MGLVTHGLGRMGAAFLTSRVLKRIHEGSFKVNVVPEPTCLPHHRPQPQLAWCYVELSGGTSPRYGQVAQYFLWALPDMPSLCHPVTAWQAQMGRNKAIHVDEVSRW